MFVIKLGQYLIILGKRQLKNFLQHICFNQNTVRFISLSYRLNCCLTREAITILGTNPCFHFALCFLTSSYKFLDFSNADEFVPDPCSRFLLYYRFWLCALFRFAKAVNLSSTDKSLDCCFCPCSRLLSVFLYSSTFKSNFLSDQTMLIDDPF